MQRLVLRVNSLLDPLSRSSLKEPVDGSGRVEDDHRSPLPRALRSSFTFFLDHPGSIELGGNRLAGVQTVAKLGQSWPLCDFSNLGQ